MPQWTRLVALALVVAAVPLSVYAQPAESPDARKEQNALRSLSGTWVILLEGHQVGLEVEDKSGTLEATLHIMGQRVLLDGSVKDGAFTLTSDAQVGDTQSHGATVKMKLTGQHQPDDTLEGEIDLPRGPMKWTAERLKTP
jgi:hypothetical protein